jgi:hypothetical protein
MNGWRPPQETQGKRTKNLDVSEADSVFRIRRGGPPSMLASRMSNDRPGPWKFSTRLDLPPAHRGVPSGFPFPRIIVIRTRIHVRSSFIFYAPGVFCFLEICYTTIAFFCGHFGLTYLVPMCHRRTNPVGFYSGETSTPS